MTEGCWAARLGGCSDKLSKEHYASQSLWLSDKVWVQGLSWCPERTEIGLSSAVARILCTVHNSALSPLDAAAGEAFDAFRKATMLNNERAKAARRKWNLIRFEADGLLLERWLLKFVINVSVMRPNNRTWQHGGVPLNVPPLDFLKMVFGQSQIRSPMGLYSVGGVGDDEYSSEQIGAIPIKQNADETVLGWLIIFRGVRFYLHLSQLGVPPDVEIPIEGAANIYTKNWRYHLPYIQYTVGDVRSHYIHIRYPGQDKAPAWTWQR